jgi:hypothetical protein
MIRRCGTRGPSEVHSAMARGSAAWGRMRCQLAPSLCSLGATLLVGTQSPHITHAFEITSSPVLAAAESQINCRRRGIIALRALSSERGKTWRGRRTLATQYLRVTQNHGPLQADGLRQWDIRPDKTRQKSLSTIFSKFVSLRPRSWASPRSQ